MSAPPKDPGFQMPARGPLHAVSAAIKRALRPIVFRRRFMAFGIPAPKAGAHSLHGMLKPACRTAYRRSQHELTFMTAGLAHGTLSRGEVRTRLLRRDRDVWAELETSNLLDPFLEDLVELFPRAKFILPVRDPFKWVRSYVDHTLFHKPGRPIEALRPYRFGPVDAERPAVEAPLQARGLFPIDRYLAWYGAYNRRALSLIPPDRLLAFRTDELGPRLPEIAAFLGLDAARLDPGQSHAFQADQKSGLVEALPADYLEARVRAHAGDLLARFFPEHALRDAPKDVTLLATTTHGERVRKEG